MLAGVVEEMETALPLGIDDDIYSPLYPLAALSLVFVPCTATPAAVESVVTADMLVISLFAPAIASVEDAEGSVIVVPSVPDNVTELLTVKVLPLASVRVAVDAGAVMATLSNDEAVTLPLTFSALEPSSAGVAPM